MHEMFSQSKRRAEAGSSPVGLEEHGGGFLGLPRAPLPTSPGAAGSPLTGAGWP